MFFYSLTMSCSLFNARKPDIAQFVEKLGDLSPFESGILVQVTYDTNNRNHIYDSSFSRATNLNSGRVLEIDYGSLVLSSLNISFNILCDFEI